MRMAEEGLPLSDAVDAVLRDNLHGLEIDERCCQIAAFALAFEAWKLTGYRPLPELHIACTGIGPQCSAEQWVKLAEESGIPMPAVGRDAIKNGLVNLHRLFSQAPTLGSLINPAELPANLIVADYETIQPYLAAIRAVEKADDETRERAIAAAGMVKAADLLAGDYTLVITNVPYLGRGAQHDVLKAFADSNCPEAKNDLATMFLVRMLQWVARSVGAGTIGAVTTQNWLYLTSYTRLRERSLDNQTWHVVARLGPGAFETIGGHVVNVALLCLSGSKSHKTHVMAGIDSLDLRTPSDKAKRLRGADSGFGIAIVPQSLQRTRTDSVINFEALSSLPALSDHAYSYQGAFDVDRFRFRLWFWELSERGEWGYHQSSPDGFSPYSGHSFFSAPRSDGSDIQKTSALLGGNEYLKGSAAWGSRGVACSWMGDLPASLYTGCVFDGMACAIVPENEKHLPAIWAFCSSPTFNVEVRKINQKMQVANATLVKVPFDLAHWQEAADKMYPDGLPEPESDDPTQWLFHGRPDEAQEGTKLQVAVARLLGYRWPAELDDKLRLSKRARALAKKCGELAKFADSDGIVCVPAVRGEEPAAERLLKLLAACNIEPGVELDDWLRNAFFEEHCKLFHDRPFVWHIWDGRKRDGFHALVNYHKLCEGGGKGRRLLESLTYAYLGEWITRQKDGVKRGEGGAEDRLAAALELQKRLEAILAGEPPFDIFVRWKPLAEQPIGWEPDINDGVRMNIRPFLASDLPLGGRTGAGILRWRPKVKWDKDRGKEPNRPKAEYPWFWNWDETTPDFMGTGKEPDGNRHNDCHYSTKVKQAARDAAKKGGK
jgi:hypothetical protein